MSKIDYPRITKLHVKNFRSLADVEIDLEPLTVLVGPNGSGKSNVVDVLRFVRDAVTGSLDRALLDRQGINSIVFQTQEDVGKDIELKLDFQSETWIGHYGFKVEILGPVGYRVKSESLFYKEGDYEARFTVEDGKFVEFSSSILDMSDPFQLSNRDLTLLTLVYAIEQIRKSDFKSEIKPFLSEMGFYNIIPDFIRYPQKSANASPLNEEGYNLASVLKYLKEKGNPAEINNILNALSKISTGVEDISVTETGSYLVTQLHHEILGSQDTLIFDLSQESDGTLRLLSILTAVYQELPRSLLAIEEPELYIHPGALGVLCDVLEEASSRSQVIITTHSPDLIERFPASAFRVVEKVNGATVVGPISDNQKEAIAKKLFSPGELMRMEGLQRKE